MKVKLATLFVSAFTGLAAAEPKVVVDIPPVHSLVSAVMGDVGAPTLVLRHGASPHGYAMAPSEARALAAADVVIWIGPELTPWLDRAIENLAEDALSVALVDAEGMQTMPFREGALFESHDHDEHHDDEKHHGDHEADHNEHGHDEHHDNAHDDHAGEEHADHTEHGDEHDEDTHDEHGHDEHGADPHIWLDPQNAKTMTMAIVQALSKADQANAGVYARNGAALIADLTALEDDIAKTLVDARERPFFVFHDAYHYFEARFEVEAAGAIAVSDASAPGPARLAEIREKIGAFDAPCVFTEPQFPETNARLVMEGTDAKLAVLDPMGATVPLGPNQYSALMRGLAGVMANCLGN